MNLNLVKLNRYLSCITIFCLLIYSSSGLAYTLSSTESPSYDGRFFILIPDEIWQPFSDYRNTVTSELRQVYTSSDGGTTVPTTYSNINYGASGYSIHVNGIGTYSFQLQVQGQIASNYGTAYTTQTLVVEVLPAENAPTPTPVPTPTVIPTATPVPCATDEKLIICENPSYDGTYYLSVPSSYWDMFKNNSSTTAEVIETFESLITNESSSRKIATIANRTTSISLSNSAPGRYTYKISIQGEYASGGWGGVYTPPESAETVVTWSPNNGSLASPGMPYSSPSEILCDSQYTVRWSGSAGATHYQVQQKVRSQGGAWPSGWTDILPLVANTEFRPTNQLGGIEHKFRLRAVSPNDLSSAGYSDWVESQVFSKPTWEYLSIQEGKFNWNDYIIYRGDFDSDGDASDFYFWGRDKFVLIHSDVSIPLMIEGPASFKVLAVGGESYNSMPTDRTCDNTSVPDTSGDSLKEAARNGTIKVVSLANQGYYGDFDSDGYAEALFVADAGTGSVVFNWSSSGEPTVSSLLNLSDHWSNVRVEIQDVNADGRDDLKIYSGNTFERVLLADSQGRFEISDSDAVDPESKKATIEETWARFSKELRDGNHAAALSYVTPHFYDKFSEILEILGDEAADVVEQVESVHPYYVGKDTAIYLINKQGDDGAFYVHTVTFYKTPSGSWKIEEL